MTFRSWIQMGLMVVLPLVNPYRGIAAGDSWDRAPIIVSAANHWHVGEPIPPELRRFRRAPGDLPSPMDSGSLIHKVENLPLLATLSLDLVADQECREDAFVQGMYVGGPTAFLALVRPLIPGGAEGTNPWTVDIKDRLARPHVVVDALSIDDKSMRAKEAEAVLDRIQADLQLGKQWQSVYEAYADEYGYRTGNRTKIVNLGHFVLESDPALGKGHYVDIQGGVTWEGEPLPRRFARLSTFDASHLPRLLSASRGDVIRLHSAVYHERVLYQVQEVYLPANR
jgi:hypothetical protein